MELFTGKTMQLLGSSKKVVENNKDGEIVPRLETVEVFLVHCNLVNNSYQQTSKVLFTFFTKQTIWSINYHHTSFTSNAENN